MLRLRPALGFTAVLLMARDFAESARRKSSTSRSFSVTRRMSTPENWKLTGKIWRTTKGISPTTSKCSMTTRSRRKASRPGYGRAMRICRSRLASVLRMQAAVERHASFEQRLDFLERALGPGALLAAWWPLGHGQCQETQLSITLASFVPLRTPESKINWSLAKPNSPGGAGAEARGSVQVPVTQSV